MTIRATLPVYVIATTYRLARTLKSKSIVHRPALAPLLAVMAVVFTLLKYLVIDEPELPQTRYAAALTKPSPVSDCLASPLAYSAAPALLLK